MKKIKVGYVPLAKASWSSERTGNIFNKSLECLKKLDVDVLCGKGLIATDGEAEELYELFYNERIDFLLIHFITFSLGSIVPTLINKLDLPVILWAMPEPAMEGGRLSSNSFCAVNMNAHTLWKMDKKYKYIYGPPEKIGDLLHTTIKSIECLRKLKETKIGLVGYRVPGFYTSNFNELKVRQSLGVEIKHIDLSEVFQQARNSTQKERDKICLQIKNSAKKIKDVTEEEIGKSADLYQAFKTLADKYSLNALAVKCWPEFSDIYGIGVCSTLGHLNNEGLIASCEADMYGAITMIIEQSLSGISPFFGDLISFDEKENTGIVWHCGAAPVCLCADFDKTRLCKHSIIDGGGVKGITNEFPLKPGAVTLARFSEGKENFRMLIATGTGLETEQILKGNPLKIKFDCKVSDLTKTIVEKGFEHHYAVVHDDITAGLLDLCKWLGIDAVVV